MGKSIQLREVFSLPAFFPDDLGLGPGPHEPCEGAEIGAVGAIGSRQAEVTEQPRMQIEPESAG